MKISSKRLHARSLTVNGAYYTRASVVHWNGGGRATQFVDEHSARAEIQTGDIAAAGTADVTVVNPPFPNGRPAVSNVVVFRITSANSY